MKFPPVGRMQLPQQTATGTRPVITHISALIIQLLPRCQVESDADAVGNWFLS
jgi:hypothetical protein